MTYQYQHPDWAICLMQACKNDPDWVSKTLLQNLYDHWERYPSFQPERVAEIFIKAEPKTRKHYCYLKISDFTKKIHKSNSFRSLCDSQS